MEDNFKIIISETLISNHMHDYIHLSPSANKITIANKKYTQTLKKVGQMQMSMN